jgi:hypothetical protein
MGDHDEFVTGCRHPRPAVGGIEQVATDHRASDVVPEGLHVVRRGLADPE